MKVFLKILDTGNLELLGDGHKVPLEDVWQIIVDEYKSIDPDNQFEKVLEMSKGIEYDRCRYHAINIAIQCLSIKKDDDLIDMLKLYGYVITEENYDKDLVKAKAYSKSILKNIEQLEKVLKEENDDEKVSFDETIIQLNMVLGYKEADANTVTVTGYYALKKIAKEKIKMMKRQK